MKKLTKNFKNMSLKNKITIIVILILLVSTSILGVFFCVHLENIVIDNTIKQSEMTLRQTSEYMNYRLKNILLEFNYLEIDEELLSIVKKEAPTIKEKRRASEILEETRIENQEFIDSIFFCNTYGYMHLQDIKTLKSGINPLETDWYRIAKSNKRRIIWDGIVKDEMFLNSSGAKKVRIVKFIESYEQEPIGVMGFELKESVINKLLRNINLNNLGKIYLVDNYGTPISSTGEIEDADKSVLKASMNMDRSDNIVNFESVVCFETLDINDWKLVYIIPRAGLTEQTRSFTIFAIYAILLSFVIFSILTKIIITWITRPVNKFSYMIKRIEKGDFSVRFNSKYDDEIGRLGDTFDNMCENIDDLMSRLSEERELKQQAELKILQEQIKSHFLYNTLDSIYWMSLSGDNEKTANMIASLAKMFRLSLNGGKDMISVESEIEHVTSYIYIEKIRKGEQYNFVIDVDKDIYSEFIPKIILQPLVENAIAHGIQKNNNGTVKIRGYRKSGFIYFEVEDDAGLMDVENVKQYLNKKESTQNGNKGYALCNLNNRLKTIYNRDDILTFKSKKGEYSLVIIKIPENNSQHKGELQ